MAQEFEFIPGWFGLPVPRVWCLLPLTRLPCRQAALHGHRWPGAAGHRRQALLLHRRRAGQSQLKMLVQLALPTAADDGGAPGGGGGGWASVYPVPSLLPS